MRAACIDIGSNTTRLLVADCDGQRLRRVHEARVLNRLGAALRRDGTISAHTLTELGEVVAAQLEAARRLGAAPVRCVGTASVRAAANREQLVSWIRRRCDGLAVEVLSDADEARLAFLGAARTLARMPSGRLGLVDVGGGSSELVVGDHDGGVSWWVSLPIGSGQLTGELVRCDPPSHDQLDRLRSRVEAALESVTPPRVALVLAVGGSATSLLQVTGDVLDERALERCLEVLTAAPADRVAVATGLEAERVKLLPAGLLILRAAAQRFERPLLVGAGGLREGVVLELAAGS